MSEMSHGISGEKMFHGISHAMNEISDLYIESIAAMATCMLNLPCDITMRCENLSNGSSHRKMYQRTWLV